MIPKTNIKNIQMKFISIASIFTLIIIYFFTSTVKNIENNYLNETDKTYNIAYETIYDQYKDISDLAFSGLVKLTNAEEVFKTFKDKDESTQKKIRKEFYEQISSRYELLKSKHIKSINFIFANNTMFLNMNNSQIYGEQLGDNRYLVKSVHENKKVIDSYELGKYGEGFKFLYPIIDNDVYLGLVEITFGAEAITSTIMEHYNVWSSFFINEKNFNKELLITKPELYGISLMKGYICDLNVLKVLKSLSKNDLNNELPSKSIIEEIHSNIKNKIFKSYYYEATSQVFTTIPIVHNITKEQEAVLLIRSTNEALNLIANNYYYILITIISIMLLVVFIIYQQIVKNIFDKELLLSNNEKETNLKDELENIFNSAQVGLVYISKVRVLIKVNSTIVKTLGYDSADEMIGLSTKEFYLTEEQFIEIGNQNYESLQTGALKNMDYQLKKKDGSVVWCEISGKAIDNSIPADLNKGVLVVISDISKRKAYEEEIRKQKEELETIFNHSQDGIAVTDLNGYFLNANKQFIKLTGFSMEELLIKNCNEITAPDDLEKNQKAIQKAIETNSVETVEKSFILKDNKIVTVSIGVSLLPDKKRLLFLVHDNTNLKIILEQSKLASMGEMIANIAHQWRQPLSVISTSITGIKLQNEFGILTDEILNNSCDNINNNVQYLSETIEDFQNFIKGNRNKVEFNLATVINSFLHLVEGTIKNRNIHIVLDLKDDLIIKGYPNELIQCFMNIFNNAKDALDEKNVENKYIFISTSIKNNNTIIKFKDNAGGISNEVLPRIFEPYFTTKHKSQGTGLGLHMTYNLIVDGMNGSIVTHNKEYKYNGIDYTGAEFTISL